MAPTSHPSFFMRRFTCTRKFGLIPVGGNLQKRTRHGPANSSQQPTTCRSSARRFRASFCATLRVALPEREGTWRLSERTLAGPEDAVIYHCSARSLLARRRQVGDLQVVRFFPPLHLADGRR